MRRPCHHYARGNCWWVRGTGRADLCRRGDKCNLAHVDGSNGHPQPSAPQVKTQPPTAPAPKASLELKTDPPFPTLSAASATQSDELVFPVRVLPYSMCKRILLSAKYDGQAINGAADADRLIGAIVQSNAYNTGWVRQLLSV